MGLGSPDCSEIFSGGGPARPQGLAAPDASHLRQGGCQMDGVDPGVFGFPGVKSD